MWQKTGVTVRPAPAWVWPGVFHLCPTDTASQGYRVPMWVFRYCFLTLLLSPSQMHATLGDFFFCILCANFWGQICVKASGLYVLVLVWEVLKYFVVTGLRWCALFRLQWALVHIPGVKSLGGFSLTVDSWHYQASFMEWCVFCWLSFCLYVQYQTCWPVDLFCIPLCAFLPFHCPYLGNSSSILFSTVP